MIDFLLLPCHLRGAHGLINPLCSVSDSFHIKIDAAFRMSKLDSCRNSRSRRSYVLFLSILMMHLMILALLVSELVWLMTHIMYSILGHSAEIL